MHSELTSLLNNFLKDNPEEDDAIKALLGYLYVMALGDIVAGTDDYADLICSLNSPDNFINQALEAVADGGEVDFDDRIIIDSTFKDNPCLFGVYEGMVKNSTVANNYLNNFDPDFSVAHLKFSAGVTGGHAITSPPEQFLIEIKFDTEILSNVPTLDVAGTFIHELIHAEIYRKLLSVASTASLYNGWTDSQWKTYVYNLKNNFPGLYDYYIRYESNVTVNGVLPDAQHQLMSQHYRGIIVNALKEFDNSQADDVYNAIAWVGLMGSGSINSTTGLPINPTVAWQNTPQAQRLQILNTYNNFKNNSTPCQ